MTLTTSRTELESAIFPLGYATREQEGDDKAVYLDITHSDFPGVSIEIAISLQDGSLAGLERVVRGGPEGEFFDASPFAYSDEFNALPEAQQEKLLKLLFGDFIAYEHFTELNELVAAIQEKIQYQPIP